MSSSPSPKRTQRLALDADIDAEEDRGNAALQRLLQRKQQQPDSGFIRCAKHMKRTKTIMQALTDEDLEEETVAQINGINGANGTVPSED